MLENTVLLVDPLLRTKHDGMYDDFGKQYDIPYGLLAIGSHLAVKGIDSMIVSMDFETRFRRLSDEEVLRQYLLEYNPKVVGFTSYTLQYEDAKRLAGIVREFSPEIKIVIGGHHVMHQPEEVLETGLFDAVVIGEGEASFEEYVTGVFNGTPVEKILNKPKKRLQGGEIATPNYALLPEDLVKNANIEVMTSRGCPNDCAFCSSSAQYGRRVMTRNLDSVREEITTLVRDYGHAKIGILDETLHARRDFDEFMDLLRELHEELGVTYLAQTRADAVVRRPESLEVMRKSGIVQLVIGAESASDSVLAAMNKGFRYEKVPKALEMIKAAGISTGTFWIVAHPGSSYEEEMKTKDAIDELLKRELSDYTEVNIFVPYAGTRAAGDWRIMNVETDFSRFNRTGQPVFDLDGFSREQIEQAHREIMSVLKKHERKKGGKQNETNNG